MGIKLGLVGLGAFGKCFAPLFAAHPLVDSVVLCDAEADRIKLVYDTMPTVSAKTKLEWSTTDFDEICRSDCDALVVITQPWLHAAQCIQAMNHGKYVYSAVPVVSLPDDEEMLDWCGRVIETVQKTGMQYMLGETTIYRPQTQFCRRMAAQGLFGNFVFAEAEYAHDLDSNCSLREVNRYRQVGKIGAMYQALEKPYLERGLKHHPMAYPTHSVSGVLDVMGARPVKVSAYGYRNANQDPFFKNYDFSDIVAMFQLDNGVPFRVAELREIASNIGLAGEDFRIFGTSGSYSNAQWNSNGRTAPTPEIKPLVKKALSDQEMFDKLPDDVVQAFKKTLGGTVEPDSDFIPSGHGGSHPYLVHEFVAAVAERRVPHVSAWEAAMYMAMGVAAHKSAQKDGEIVAVTDFGTRPDRG